MTSEEAEARDRLLFHLDNQTGFWFALVIGDDPRPRARLREAAEAFCKKDGQPFHVHTPLPHQLPGLAAELAKGESPGLHWIRADGPRGLIEQWESAASELLTAMNERREAYRKRLDGGVVIEGRESLKRQLRDLAPDLFSIRAFIAEPGINPGADKASIREWREPMYLNWSTLSGASDPDREIERAARLKDVEGLGARRAGADALFKGIYGLIIAGRVQEAEKLSDELASQAERLSPESAQNASVSRFLISERYLQGLVAAQSGNTAQAMQRLDQAILMVKAQIDSDAAAIKPAGRRVLAEILRVRGYALSDQGDLQSATESYREYLSIIRQFAEADNSNQRLQTALITASRELADALLKQGDLSSAEDLLRETASREERHAAEHPADHYWRLELLRCRRALGNVLAARGDLAAALEEHRSALLVAEEIAEREPSDEQLQLEIWLAHSNTVNALAAQEDWSEALTVTTHELSVAERGFDRGRDPMWGWLVASSHAKRAEILQKKGETDAANVALLRVWTYTRGLLIRPIDAQIANEIVLLHINLGLAQLASALLSGAGVLKRAVKLGERTRAAAPNDLQTMSRLTNAYTCLALALKFLGRIRAARKARRKANALRRRWFPYR